ncbi:hypothetical protein NE237_015961 [Protea cynaroides]|uniref:Uncharacterized protein n=1 Tax=Protea cynaroides TaxID=273540 RepID=A0A9Q0KF22_9MAGN|nr:hypothetical protein NE237_015961 [Protea cynaroides]
MGNCFKAPSSLDNAHSTQTSFAPGASNVTSKTTSTSAVSSLTFPSYSENSTTESLPTPRSEGEILQSANLKSFSFSELKNATRNFRPDSLLGEGGFGYVYKGWIDEHTLAAAKPGSGLVVAIKKLKQEGSQGHKEWLVGFFISYNFFFNYSFSFFFLSGLLIPNSD